MDNLYAKDSLAREAPNYNKADGAPKAGDLRINDKGEFEAWVQTLGWIPANESQWSISMWAEKTFGQLRNFNTVAIRTNLEMGELLRACDALDNAVRDGKHEAFSKLKAAVAEEGVDVIITLMRIFTTLGVDYRQEINKKMMVNRQRKWTLDGNGTGQHVRESPGTGKGATASVDNTLEGPEG
jgi:NTP pyrophosphatase (non-canonical NTP hydrolase)